jgi:hypothetical protein
MDIFEIYQILLVQSIRAPYDFQTFSCLDVKRNNNKDFLAFMILLCRASLHSFFIDRQSARELRITSIPRDAAI